MVLVCFLINFDLKAKLLVRGVLVALNELTSIDFHLQRSDQIYQNQHETLALWLSVVTINQHKSLINSDLIER